MGRKDYYFNPVARPQMQEIIADATEKRWPQAIRRFMTEVKFNPDWMDNLVADGRYAWKLFLNLPPDARVLDLGCGLGNLTKNLAPHVAEVFALDLTWERLQFAKRRFAIFNRDDRISLLAGGDGDHLPFADATFDAVMISGVLEWVADDSSLWAHNSGRFEKVCRMIRVHFGKHNPRRVQLRFLREIRRVLKPTGLAFVGIENRLSHQYFGGRPDHHSGLWFGSLLPRPIATLYSIVRAHVPYRTYTYAHPGYRRLLRQAGFAECKFLGLTPGYSRLSEIIPFEDHTGRWQASHDAGSGGGRLASSKLFVPAYGIVASASVGEHKPTSLIERIAREAATAAGTAEADLRLHRLRITDNAVAIASGMLRERSVVLRIPLNEGAAAAESANHAALINIASSALELRAKVPAPIARGSVQNLAYHVEAAVPGAAMTTALPGTALLSLLPEIGKLLREINPDLRRTRPVIFNNDIFSSEVDTRLASINSVIENRALIAAARGTLSELLLGIDVRFGLTHGNLVPENINISHNAVTGVVNWGCWSPSGLPILDCLRFAHGLLRENKPGLGATESIALLCDFDLLPLELRSFLQGQYEALGLDLARHQGFVYLSWLQHLANNIEVIALDPKRLEASVTCVLQTMAIAPRMFRAPVLRTA